MEEKRFCIICGKEKNKTEFNKEHIIPESLGNKSLYFYNLCKDCNSKLGTKVDKYLTDSFFGLIERNLNKIKSKKGIIINPFKEGRDEEGRIIRTNDNFEPYMENRISVTDKKIQVECSDFETGKEIIRKHLLREGKSDDEIENILRKVSYKKEKFNPILKKEFKIELGKIELAFLKIAYEYSYKLFGDDFLKDKQAMKIQNILKNAKEGKYIKCDDIVCRIPNPIFSSLKKYEELISRNHIIFICNDYNRLILNIILFNNEALSYSVIISYEPNIYNNIDKIEIIPINGEKDKKVNN